MVGNVPSRASVSRVVVRHGTHARKYHQECGGGRETSRTPTLQQVMGQHNIIFLCELCTFQGQRLLSTLTPCVNKQHTSPSEITVDLFTNKTNAHAKKPRPTNPLKCLLPVFSPATR